MVGAGGAGVLSVLRTPQSVCYGSVEWRLWNSDHVSHVSHVSHVFIFSVITT